LYLHSEDGTHKLDNRYRALGLILRRRLHESALAAKERVKLGRLEHLVELDRLGRSLELQPFGLAFLLEPSLFVSTYPRRMPGRAPIKDLLDLHFTLLLVGLAGRRVGRRAGR
jgi:hypothetical protein